jgi:arginine metabolism regulation protein II
MVVQMSEECSFNSCLDFDRILRELQESTQDGFRRIGPFGVLPIGNESSPEYEETTAVPIIEDLVPLSTPELDMVLTDSVWGDIENLGDIPENAVVRDLDWGSCVMGQTLDGNSPYHPNWATVIPTTTSPRYYHNHDSGNQIALAESHQPKTNSLPSTEPSTLTIFDSWNISSPILIMSNDENLSKLPPEARSLLNYYSLRIIDVMSMSPIQKTPWETIHLPCAMSALADVMVYGETKSFAKMALLYALLSISSFHIGLAEKTSEERSQYWNARGALHKRKAEKYLQSALDKSLPKATKGKYKEVLMSILSMVTIGVSYL